MWRTLFRRTATEPSVLIACGGRRTGTTLLAAILASDPRTNPLGQEAQIVTRLLETYRWSRENFDNFGRSFFDDLDGLRSFFQESTARFAHQVSARISPGGVLILKNPELSLVLSDALELFPNAKLLATVRDPRDQVAAELQVQERQVAAGMTPPGYDPRDMSRLTGYYLSYCREIMELRRQHPEKIYLVRYEDLVLTTEDVLTGLREFTGLGLPFNPTEPWQRVSPLAGLYSGPSRSDLYGGPVDTRSVGRFKRDLTENEVAIIEEISAHFMSELGY